MPPAVLPVLRFAVKQGKRAVMIVGVIYKTVVGKYYSFCSARGCTKRVNIALGVCTAGFFGEHTLIVTKPVAANAFAGRVGFQPAA